MVYNNNYSKGFGEDTENSGLVYDLRQTYAQILDEVLKRIAECRVKGEFVEWFNALEHLKIEINQKLTTKEREKYKEILKKCVIILKKNSAVFNKQSHNNEGIFEVKGALRELEEWLKDSMEEHKLYGDKEMSEIGL